MVKQIIELRKQGLQCGARKAQVYLSKYFSTNVGRDCLFTIMAKNNLQCNYYKKRKITSTGHRSNYPNLLKDNNIRSFGQAIVSDITYIHLPNNKFCYISLISDLQTRLILGDNVSNNLQVESSLKAMKKVIRQYSLPENTIHHSDHGVQYTSKKYKNYLKSKGFKISMTGKDKCYDNAQAERIFNTLKHEYGFKKTFKNINEVKLELKAFIKSYNTFRIHESLGYDTPLEAYNKLVSTA